MSLVFNNLTISDLCRFYIDVRCIFVQTFPTICHACRSPFNLTEVDNKGAIRIAAGVTFSSSKGSFQFPGGLVQYKYKLWIQIPGSKGIASHTHDNVLNAYICCYALEDVHTN